MTTHIRRQPRRFALLAAMTILSIGALLAIHPATRALATSGDNPYTVPFAVDSNPDPNVFETTLVSEESNVDLGNGVTAHAQTFNGQIPGPTFRLKVGDTVIVHYENHLTRESGVHWHGIELTNAMDGTPFTQNMVPPGGKFLYKFKVSRPGIYWYHPHHHASTNQVFKGLYGMILITDPNEAPLRTAGTLPSAADTLPIVLSDITVCHNPGGNEPFGANKSYDPALPWVGPSPPQAGAETGALPGQASPRPLNLCETEPIDVDGNDLPAGTTFHEGDVPNNQTLAANGRTNEGTTVLTNGMNVGGRGGKPTAPGGLAADAFTYGVKAGQGLRLELLNAATTRFFRLRLTDNGGTQIPLVRVGGEGGLLDNAVTEGGIVGGYDTKFTANEILIDPGSRSDVVIAVPPGAAVGDVLTLWTEDYLRTGMGFSNVPTVPVMHLKVTGTVGGPPFTIAAGTPLRAATGDPVPVLGGPVNNLLDPSTFTPAKVGFVPGAAPNDDLENLRLTATGGPAGLGINDVFGTHDVGVDYTVADHLGSTRYAKLGDTLELTVENTTGGAHHPYHLHGFSMQPISLEKTGGGGPDYIWPYHEFRDNVDVPAGYTYRFRVKLDDRMLADGTTPGGGLGRWLFHCHIFFHATNGMLGELVVVANPNGNEKPDVNADTTSVEVNEGTAAAATGTYHDIDGDAVTLSSSVGTVTDTGSGHWSWSFTPTNGPAQSQYVYVTATDAGGKKDEAVFFLKVNNVPPTVTITSPAPNAVFPAPATVTVNALVADPGSGDTEHCTFDWGGGGPTSFDTEPAGGTCTQSNTFTTPGTYTITVTADDGDGGTDSDTVTIKIVTALSLKQDVLAQAIALQPTATVNPEEDQIKTVVQKLTDALKPERWIDGNRIRVDKGGEEFDREKDAVKAMMAMIKDTHGPIPDATLQGMIDSLEQADQILAQTAISDAIAAGGKPARIAEAQTELTKAAQELAMSDFDDAISHYKNAWQKAKDSLH